MRHLKNTALIALTTIFMTPALSFAEQKKEQDPTHIHKDDYVEYCISRDKPEAFCQCNMTMVNDRIQARKARHETMIKGAEERRQKKGKMYIKRKWVKDTTELETVCTLVNQKENDEISEEEFNEKTASYQPHILREITKGSCTLSERDAKILKEYEEGEYKYVNAAYIMTNDNPCKKHLHK